MKKIAIIGAGPAGFMTLATILENSKNTDIEIHIFEKNSSPGKKLLISGGGRCNITTSLSDIKTLSTKYVRGWEFIRNAMENFSPKKCYDWFESHGLPLKIEPINRVFPLSDNGRDVLSVFERIFAKNRDKVRFHYSEGVTEVTHVDSKFILKTNRGIYDFHSLIIATGGNAYSHTGSTGDGYHFVRSLGHTITELGPSLSSFVTKEKWLHELSGIAFEEAMIDGLKGALLLTHFGISGPLTFMLSAELAWVDIGKGKTYKPSFSPIANMGLNEWNNYLRTSFESSPKKSLATILSEKLPKRFAEGVVKEFFPHLSETFVGSISKKNREELAKLLGDGIPTTLIERRPGDEFVTAGGVNTDEIDPETMESKIQKNLYFAGEILNVDGYTGGFSLQICWSSGYVAGYEITQRLE